MKRFTIGRYKSGRLEDSKRDLSKHLNEFIRLTLPGNSCLRYDVGVSLEIRLYPIGLYSFIEQFQRVTYEAN